MARRAHASFDTGSGARPASPLPKEAGLIRYSRGRITIRDGGRLEEASCECYRVVREQHERILGHSGVST